MAVARPAILVGRRQDPAAIDAGELTRLGWELQRRLTPGGAVYMDAGAVCLEVAIPASHPAATPDVVRATRWFGELLAGALRRLGVDAECADTSSAPATGLAAEACFASWVRGEVLVAGRKVFGTAQYRRRGHALFQGVALTQGSHAAVAAVLAGPPPRRAEAAGVIQLHSAALENLNSQALAASIRGFLAAAAVPLHPAGP